MGVRVEVATSGVDESLQGLTSDPYGAVIPAWTGLRIPSLRPNDQTRYLFLLASRKVTKPTRIRGIRQLLTLGFTITTTEGESPSQVQTFTLPVSSPSFKAPDGNVSWHLVSEPNPDPSISTPVSANWVEGPNLRYRQSDSSALLFENITFEDGVQTAYYATTLATYQAPAIGTSQWQPLGGGLENMHDLRFPWEAARAWDSLDIPFCAVGERRISLYASVLQTAGLPAPVSTPVGTSSPFFGPEIAFALTAAGVNAAAVSGVTASAVQFWSVGGAIIFEDYDCGCGNTACSHGGA